MDLVTEGNQRTAESDNVEKVFHEAGFPDTKVYRHNSASIRVRVRDERFRKLSRVARMDLLEPIIDKLPEDTRQDLIFVLPIAPGEEKAGKFKLMNLEFDEPRPASF